MIAGKAAALTLDTGMCVMMYAFQRRHRLNSESRRDLETYIAAHESSTRDAYFAAPPILPIPPIPSSAATLPNPNFAAATIHWSSPISTAHPENNRTHVDLF